LDILSTEKSGTGNICVSISITSKQSLVHQHALLLLSKRQPMLRAVIAMANGHRYFEIKEINEVMLDITTSDVKAFDWQSVWFEYTAKQSGNGLLWRVVILQEEFMQDTKDYANTLMFKGIWQYIFLLFHCKELLKLYVNLIYRFCVTILFLEIF
jgi:hypothetical protein